MRSFWVLDDSCEYPGIIAPTYEEAETIFWQGVLADEYPFDAIMVEMILDEGDFEIIYQVEDEDILSIEEASWPSSS